MSYLKKNWIFLLVIYPNWCQTDIYSRLTVTVGFDSSKMLQLSQTSMVRLGYWFQSLDQRAEAFFLDTVFWSEVQQAIIPREILCWRRQTHQFLHLLWSQRSKVMQTWEMLCFVLTEVLPEQQTSLCLTNSWPAICIYLLIHNLMVSESESGFFYLFCASCGHFAAGTPAFSSFMCVSFSRQACGP